MTNRIRWEPTEYGGFTGHVGTMEPWAFQVWQSGSDHDDVVLGEWVLSIQLPGRRDERLPHGHDPKALKAEAERWLERFISSLGAVFPEDGGYDFGDEDEDGEPLEVKYAAGRRVRFAHPDGGYPGEAEEAAKHLTPGAVYVIGWADIGQSRTDLNLFAGRKPVGRFNSVLFEPVEDEEPVPSRPEEGQP